MPSKTGSRHALVAVSSGAHMRAGSSTPFSLDSLMPISSSRRMSLVILKRQAPIVLSWPLTFTSESFVSWKSKAGGRSISAALNENALDFLPGHSQLLLEERQDFIFFAFLIEEAVIRQLVELLLQPALRFVPVPCPWESGCQGIPCDVRLLMAEAGIPRWRIACGK